MNKLRKVAIFMAIVSLIFLVVAQFVPSFDMEIGEEIAKYIAAFFLAVGFLADTGKDPQPLTWETFIEKLKSPLAVGSLFALLSYIVYLRLAPEQADIILKVVDMIILSIFGFSVYNNPNNRDAIR